MFANKNQGLTESIGWEHEKMSQLEPSDLYALMEIQDLLDSNNLGSARVKLGKLLPAKLKHPSALYMAYQIHAKAGEWDKAIQIADSLFREMPDYPGAWLILAETACRKPDDSLLEAKEILLKAESKFSGNFLIALKLASFCVQLVQFDEAKKWIEIAMAIDRERSLQIAAGDADLMRLSSLGEKPNGRSSS